MVSNTLLYGSTLKQNKPPAPQSGNNVVKLTGKYNGVNGTVSSFVLDESILSKHSLLIGGTGCGKTTLFYHLISQVKRRMTQDDVMIIFDSKGDFYSKFAKPGDLVIGNSPQYYQKSERWNIFKEVLADGWDEERYNINAQEICKAFFKERTEKNQSNAFFPNAARDLLAALVASFIKAAKEDDPAGHNSPIASEYVYNDKFSLRAGYHHESQYQGNRKYATFGAGFKLNVLAIDASYCCATTAGNPLDQTIRVGLMFDFDGIQELMGRRRRR